MLITKHKRLYDQVSKLRAFGVDRTHSERSVPGAYDVPTLGLNYRMSEMQSALGRAQLNTLDDNLSRRRANFERLKAAASMIRGMRVIDSVDDRASNSHYCLSVMLTGDAAARRNEIVARLNAAGVGTSIYYPQPVPRMTYYRNKYGYDESRYAGAAAIADASIALPVGPHVACDDVNYIGRVLERAVE
jgi:dTDP-4-amino-4,6-dideoxygalactose transaminase